MAIRLTYELAVPPGRLHEVHELFCDRYLPSAAARGMKYTGAYITPPIELDDAPTTLVIGFELDDENAVWAMKRVAASSADVHQFWTDIDQVVVTRSRRFFIPVEA